MELLADFLRFCGLDPEEFHFGFCHPTMCNGIGPTGTKAVSVREITSGQKIVFRVQSPEGPDPARSYVFTVTCPTTVKGMTVEEFHELFSSQVQQFNTGQSPLEGSAEKMADKDNVVQSADQIPDFAWESLEFTRLQENSDRIRALLAKANRLRNHSDLIQSLQGQIERANQALELLDGSAWGSVSHQLKGSIAEQGIHLEALRVEAECLPVILHQLEQMLGPISIFNDRCDSVITSVPE